MALQTLTLHRGKPCLSHALLTLGIPGCGGSLQPCTAGEMQGCSQGGSQHGRGLQVGVRAQGELLRMARAAP